MAAFGWATGRLAWTPGLLLLLLLYPLWALVEQFLLQAMLARNLAGRFRAPAVALACAALFAVDHVPDWPLVPATFALGLFATSFYLRHRTLLPLALAHGWLGSIFFVWVLGRDPLRVFLGVA
jgi:membrane protease YdiL (CAAX protease family)